MSPTEICVQCDLIQESVVGNESMKTLGYFPLIGKFDDNVMTFNIKSDNFTKLITKSFDTIEITLTDLNGNILPYDENFDNISTVVTLMFSYF